MQIKHHPLDMTSLQLQPIPSDSPVVVCAVWMGHIDGPAEKQAQYAVDEVFYADELEQVLENKRPDLVYLLEGENSDRYISL